MCDVQSSIRSRAVQTIVLAQLRRQVAGQEPRIEPRKDRCSDADSRQQTNTRQQAEGRGRLAIGYTDAS